MVGARKAQLLLLVGILSMTMITPNRVLAAENGLAERLSELKQLYAFDTWAGRTKQTYRRLLQEFRVDTQRLGEFERVRYEEHESTREGRRPKSYYLTVRVSETETSLAKIKLLECQSIPDAHLAMLEFFLTCQARHPFPRGESRGVDIGDVCYTGWGKTIAGLTFVRNNVFVYVKNETGLPVVELAARIDKLLLEESMRPPEEPAKQ